MSYHIFKKNNKEKLVNQSEFKKEYRLPNKIIDYFKFKDYITPKKDIYNNQISKFRYSSETIPIEHNIDYI